MVPGELKLRQQLGELEHLDFTPAKLIAMGLVYDESQTLVPVDTGELKDSGHYDANGVYYDKDYAGFVEYGTVKMRAQPYLRPAVENHKHEIVKAMADELNHQIKTEVI